MARSHYSGDASCLSRPRRMFGVSAIVFQIECRENAQFIGELGEELGWATLFGYAPWSGNLDALTDAFHQLSREGDEQLALCLASYNALADQDPHFARGVLDVIERGSRSHLLSGRKLVALIQTNDPDFHCDGLGAAAARWNRAEWLNASRGLQVVPRS